MKFNLFKRKKSKASKKKSTKSSNNNETTEPVEDQKEHEATLRDTLKIVDYKPRPVNRISFHARQRSEAVIDAVLSLNASAFSNEKCLEQDKHMVRVFISSTFTDTRWERDVFMQFYVPQLREFCRNRGLEFQPSEMRWGIDDDASARHETSEICMHELDRCLKESAGISFIGIIGNKYGYRPFPSRIDAILFEKLLAEMQKEHAALLNTWFKCDRNAVPAQYRLLPIKTNIPKYNSSVSDEHSNKWWSEGFEPMQQYLRDAAVALQEKKQITDLEANLFIRSVTEEEMYTGIIAPIVQTNMKSNPKSLLLLRDLQPSPDSRGFYDGEDKLLQKLKEQIASHVPKENTITTKLKWKKGFEPRLNKDHATYIRETLDDISEKLRSSVLSASKFIPDKTFDEVQRHLLFATKKIENFAGRESVVQEVVRSLSTNAFTCLHGMSGSGKTSLLAKAVSQLRKENDTGIVVLRFIGTSALSTTPRSIIESCSEQIWRITKSNEPMPTLPFDFVELVDFFHHQILTLATETAPIYLVVDSLDQISGVQEFGWLPTTQIPFVHVLVSTIEENHVSNLKAICKPSLSELNVAVFTVKDARTILSAWFDRTKRSLTESQMDHVLGRIDAAGDFATPLMLRVVFLEANKWTSYHEIDSTFSKVVSMETALDRFFDRLHKRHNDFMVTEVFIYLTLARDGLSAIELEDLLSMNNTLLNSVFQYWVPPIARIPPLLLTRLLQDVEEFVQMKGTLYTWYHRQFREYAEKRYLSSPDTLNQYLRKLQGFFSEQSKAELLNGKSFILDHKVNGELWKLNNDRQIQNQPNMLTHDLPNRRKLRELPWALFKMKDTKGLESLLFDFDFLLSSLKSGLLDDLTMFAESVDTFSMRYLAKFLRTSVTLKEQPEQLASLILGRTNEKSIASKLVKTLKRDASNFQSQNTWWKPYGPILEPSTPSPLIRTQFAKGNKQWQRMFKEAPPVIGVNFSLDNSMFATALGDGTVRLYNSTTGEPLLNGRALVGDEGDWTTNVCFSPNNKYVATGYDGNNSIVVWETATGEQVIRLAPTVPTTSAPFLFTNDSKAIVSPLYGQRYKWRLKDGKEIVDEKMPMIPSGKGGDYMCVDATFSIVGTRDGDNKLVTCDSSLSNLSTENFSVYFPQMKIAKLSPSTLKPCIAFVYNSTIKLVDLSSGKNYAIIGELSFEKNIQEVAFNCDGSIVVAVTMKGNIRAWNTETLQELGSAVEKSKIRRPKCPIAFHPTIKTQFLFGIDIVKLWEIDSNGFSVLNTFESKEETKRSEIRCITYLPSGKQFLCSTASRVEFWDIEHTKRLCAKDYGFVSAIAISSDGTVAAIAEPMKHEIHFAKLEASEIVTQDKMELSKGSSKDMYFSKDGKTLAVATETGCTGVRFIDVESRKEKESNHDGSPQLVVTLSYVGDSLKYLTYGQSKSLRFWDTKTMNAMFEGKSFYGEKAVVAASFNAENTQVACSHADHSVNIYDMATWEKVLNNTLVSKNEISAIALSDSRILGGSVDASINLWDKEMAIHSTWDEETIDSSELGGQSVQNISVLARRMLYVTYSKDNKLVAVTNDTSNKFTEADISIVDVATGKQICVYKGYELSHLKFCGDYLYGCNMNGQLVKMDYKQKSIVSKDIDIDFGTVVTFAVAHGGEYIALGSFSNHAEGGYTMQLIDTNTLLPLKKQGIVSSVDTTPVEYIDGVVFSNDDTKLVVSQAFDTSAKHYVFNLITGENEGQLDVTLKTKSSTRFMFFSPNGKYLLLVSTNGEVIVVNFETRKQVDHEPLTIMGGVPTLRFVSNTSFIANTGDRSTLCEFEISQNGVKTNTITHQMKHLSSPGDWTPLVEYRETSILSPKRNGTNFPLDRGLTPANHSRFLFLDGKIYCCFFTISSLRAEVLELCNS